MKRNIGVDGWLHLFISFCLFKLLFLDKLKNDIKFDPLSSQSIVPTTTHACHLFDKQKENQVNVSVILDNQYLCNMYLLYFLKERISLL